MKIKLVDSTIYSVKRADIINGKLEIDFLEKTAEEIQEIFLDPGNLVKIDLLSDDGDKFGELLGWTNYGGVIVMKETKTVLLCKATDITEERLARIEADAIMANIAATAAKDLSEESAGQITDLQMALTEIYEGFELLQSSDQLRETPVD